jgi:CheY-like chemotaxis protein
VQLNGAKVLIVDDSAAIRASLSALLRDVGAEVLEAGDGREALKVLRHHPSLTLVVTDILMPEMDGINLLLSLRREHPTTPAIAMSGGGRVPKADYLESAQELGATAVIAKPFAPEELLRLIDGI